MLPAAGLDLDLHLQLAGRRKVRDDVVRIDDLDVVGRLDVGRRHRPLALLLERKDGLAAVVQAEHHALQVEQDVDDVLAHPVEGRVLVNDACDLHLRGCVAGHGGEQDAPQRVAERVSVAALERLHRHARVIRGEVLYVDNTRLQESRLGHRCPVS
jgi:hypothetical protein